MVAENKLTVKTVHPLVQPVLFCSLCFVNFFSLCSVISLLCSWFHCFFMFLHAPLFSVLSVWKRRYCGCTCMAFFLPFTVSKYRTLSACSCMLWWRELLDICVWTRVWLWRTRARIIRFYYEEVEQSLLHLQAGSPPHRLHRPLSHTQSDEDRSPERSVSDFTQSFPLPRSQTSLCCSKNKIPAVKLSALRFCAFDA